MATITKLIDDINGKPADETIAFGIEDDQYEIDLSAPNARKLREVFAPYVEHGRRAVVPRELPKGKRAGKAGEKAAQTAYNLKVRAWAKLTDYPTWNPEARGRIPAAVYEDYNRAMANGNGR